MATLLLLAGAIAVGCGGVGDGGEQDEDAGVLAWLPQDTWMVASINASPQAIDQAVKTLDRLPIWSLAEGYLPASDGAGLRRELLEQIARRASSEGGAGAGGDEGAPGSAAGLTADELERAFGEHAGLAIVDNDFASWETERPPMVVWIDVDDEDAAVDALTRSLDGEVRTAEHAGVEYHHDSGSGEGSDAGDGAFLVRDELALVAPSARQLEALIDVRGGDTSLADDQAGRAVIEAGIGEALAGAVVQTDPLLEAAPELVRASGRRTRKTGAAGAGRAEAIADDLGPVLASPSVDGLVADWIGSSFTIDETGLRIRGAWSNPRELADPETGTRELVERMPADVVTVSGAVSDGSGIGRLQDAWTEVREAYDLDLRDMAGDCPRADRWACDLGAELALAVLEDEALAEARREQGDTSTVLVQDIAPLLQVGAGRQPEAQGRRAEAPDARVFEIATTAEPMAWRPPPRLALRAVQAGLVVGSNEDQTQVTLRVREDSPLARAIRRGLDGNMQAALASVGIDVRQLFTSEGITMRTQEVDGLQVAGLPQEAPSRIVPALEGDAEVLGAVETYEETVEAAEPPDRVGSYGYLDLRSYVVSLVEAAGGEDRQTRQYLPTVRNNLADMPGVVWWSTREDVDGEIVGVLEQVVPIHE